MLFYARKRRQAPAVIIVALIDILIVLLIFLMVTSTFRQQQQALKVALPESSQSQKVGAQENPPLIVTVDVKGGFRLDKTPVTLEQLKPALKEALAKTPEITVAINSDENAPMGRVLKVMDAARESGIKKVNVLTKEQAKP
jgi:biopolymer transport protein ExbD